MAFPIDLVNERTYGDHWQGEAMICDIDRTYLYTRFSSLKGISRIPFEFAVDKVDIEGMAALLRQVRRGPGPGSRSTPLYFVSASPAQLRSVIQRKMLLDRLEFDGTTFKDWLGVARRLTPRRFKEQLGFKLTALLTLAGQLPRGAKLLLMGDDLETDPLAFALLADAVSGALSPDTVRDLLLRRGVMAEDADAIRQMLEQDPQPVAGVKAAYIRMERHGQPEAFLPYWPHLTVCRGAFQMAVGLWACGSLGQQGVVQVAEDLVIRGHKPEVLHDRLVECALRGIVDREQATELHQALLQKNLARPLTVIPDPSPAWADAAKANGDQPWTPAEEITK